MYFNLLTKIKNAQVAKKEFIRVPFSKMDFAVAELLQKKKFVKGVTKRGKGTKRVLEVQINYENGQGVIEGIKILSKPSRRLFVGYKDLKPVRQGFGIAVLSTPKGILAGKEARREKVGGQLLFEIW